MINQNKRSIGFMNLKFDSKYDPLQSLEKFDPRKIPSLFTEVLAPSTNDPQNFDDSLQMLEDLAFPNESQQRKQMQMNNQQNQLQEQKGIIDNFKLERNLYKHFLNEHKDGDVTYIQLDKPEINRQANIIFFGAQFEELHIKNIYKALNVIKPDIVLVQVKPDFMLDNIQIEQFRMKQESNDLNQQIEWVLDSDKYLQQLIRNGYELHTSLKGKSQIQKQLRKEGIITEKIPVGLSNEEYDQKKQQIKQFEDYFTEQFSQISRI